MEQPCARQELASRDGRAVPPHAHDERGGVAENEGKEVVGVPTFAFVSIQGANMHPRYLLGLLLLILVSALAGAQDGKTPRTVKDEAKVFSKETVEEVNATASKIRKQHGKDLLIETV